MTDHKHNPARRRLLLNAAGTAAAAMAASSTASAAASRKWNRETDIICVGSGAAGLTAAVMSAALGSGEDIANAVQWLASDAASYVSGTLLTVDGAFLAA